MKGLCEKSFENVRKNQRSTGGMQFDNLKTYIPVPTWTQTRRLKLDTGKIWQQFGFQETSTKFFEKRPALDANITRPHRTAENPTNFTYDAQHDP